MIVVVFRFSLVKELFWKKKERKREVVEGSRAESWNHLLKFKFLFCLLLAMRSWKVS